MSGITLTDNLHSHFQSFYDNIQAHLGVDLLTLPDPDSHRHSFSDHLSPLSEPVRKRFEAELFHEGPLCPLLKDFEICEIMLNGPEEIYFEKKGEIHRLNDRFFTAHTYRNFIERVCEEANVSVNLDSPFADGKWRDFRIHIVTTPLTNKFTTLTLRRHPPSPWTLERLLQNEWCTFEQSEELKKLVLQKKNLIIIGPTGSGKTSVLNALIAECPKQERVLSIEDTDEIKLQNPLGVKLLTRDDPNKLLRNYDQCDLLKQALRMRPDRILLGEVRGGEAKDLLMAFATGHKGGMATLHSEDARQALLRLEMLVQLGAPQWSLTAIRQLIYLSVDAIVVVGQREGRRQFISLNRLVSLEENGILIEAVSI